MNSYVRYLEDIIKLREQEIKIYKEYIEKELGERICMETNAAPTLKSGEGYYKTIIIPEARYVININNSML